jgi:hypothetical protein
MYLKQLEAFICVMVIGSYIFRFNLNFLHGDY